MPTDKSGNVSDRPTYLEPRVAKLETSMERLTDDVRDLANIVRTQGTTMEGEIQKLVVAVTQASGPRKTDWSVVISAVLLVMAIGSAVFWPLNQTTQDSKTRIEAYHQSMVEHQKMDMHPVGEAKIQVLVKDIDITKLELIKRDADLDIKIQKETQLMTDLLAARLTALDNRLQMEMNLKNQIIQTELTSFGLKQDQFNDKIYGRVVSLEAERIKTADKEHDELMLWRQKAMGLSSTDSVVPLIKRDSILEQKK